MLNRCMALLCFWVKSVRLLDMDRLESWTGQQAASGELSRRATAARDKQLSLYQPDIVHETLHVAVSGQR